MSASTHQKTVKDFCQAWENLDIEGVLALMSEDAVYHNMPMAPLEGREQIRVFLTAFLGAASICRFEILTIVADEERVVTERLDSFELAGNLLSALPVLGIFEFNAVGEISHWREYFDLKTWADKGGPAIG
ncbi:MAG: nuclear transport factor 2 family protein [Porticoccaceae bacterium]|nr:nuclear transport factor 2 family protein [Porticoccaceae bacterium]OUS09310.1 limonene-1,2-epoxide hydrolase [Gammaproteobacteria bacterium 54_18_T64]